MNDFMKIMMERRSIRKYKKTQISDEDLEQILYAAAFSPNAGNRQTTQIVVCQNAALNDRLGKMKKSQSHVRISTPNHYISRVQPSIADDPSIPSAFYEAPTVITLFGPRNFWFKDADCYIMANNICLAAYSLGIGSCIIGSVEDIFNNDAGRNVLQEWNIPDNYQAVVHITLGYSQTDFPSGKKLKYPESVIIR